MKKAVVRLKEIILKHLHGQHDDRMHGNRGASTHGITPSSEILRAEGQHGVNYSISASGEVFASKNAKVLGEKVGSRKITDEEIQNAQALFGYKINRNPNGTLQVDERSAYSHSPGSVNYTYGRKTIQSMKKAPHEMTLDEFSQTYQPKLPKPQARAVSKFVWKQVVASAILGKTTVPESVLAEYSTVLQS